MFLETYRNIKVAHKGIVELFVDLDQQIDVVSPLGDSSAKAILTKRNSNYRWRTSNENAAFVFEHLIYHRSDLDGNYQERMVNKWFGTATMPETEHQNRTSEQRQKFLKNRINPTSRTEEHAKHPTWITSVFIFVGAGGTGGVYIYKLSPVTSRNWHTYSCLRRWHRWTKRT